VAECVENAFTIHCRVSRGDVDPAHRDTAGTSFRELPELMAGADVLLRNTKTMHLQSTALQLVRMP
jgi:hypothetical protein